MHHCLGPNLKTKMLHTPLDLTIHHIFGQFLKAMHHGHPLIRWTFNPDKHNYLNTINICYIFTHIQAPKPGAVYDHLQIYLLIYQILASLVCIHITHTPTITSLIQHLAPLLPQHCLIPRMSIARLILPML